MSLHLVVAYETASSPELREALFKQAHVEGRNAFVLLVPATPTHHLLLIKDGKAEETAHRMALSAKSHLEAVGLTVAKALVGDQDPIKAIGDELVAEPDYASIIICTHPADVSRWLKAEVPARAQTFGLPVVHIIVRSVAESVRYK